MQASGIGHIDRVFRIDRDAVRKMQSAPLCERLAIWSELLNSMVARVGNVQIAGRIQSDAGRQNELAGSRANLAPRAERSAVGDGEALNPVVGSIRHKECSLAVEGDAARPLEGILAGARVTKCRKHAAGG